MWIYFSKGVLKFIARPTKNQTGKETLKGQKALLIQHRSENSRNPWSKDSCKIVSNITQLKGAHYEFPKPDQITAEIIIKSKCI